LVSRAIKDPWVFKVPLTEHRVSRDGKGSKGLKVSKDLRDSMVLKGSRDGKVLEAGLRVSKDSRDLLEQAEPQYHKLATLIYFPT